MLKPDFVSKLFQVGKRQLANKKGQMANSKPARIELLGEELFLLATPTQLPWVTR